MDIGSYTYIMNTAYPNANKKRGQNIRNITPGDLFRIVLSDVRKFAVHTK